MGRGKHPSTHFYTKSDYGRINFTPAKIHSWSKSLIVYFNSAKGSMLSLLTGKFAPRPRLRPISVSDALAENPGIEGPSYLTFTLAMLSPKIPYKSTFSCRK